MRHRCGGASRMPAYLRVISQRHDGSVAWTACHGGAPGARCCLPARRHGGEVAKSAGVDTQQAVRIWRAHTSDLQQDAILRDHGWYRELKCSSTSSRGPSSCDVLCWCWCCCWLRQSLARGCTALPMHFVEACQVVALSHFSRKFRTFRHNMTYYETDVVCRWQGFAC